MTDPAEGVPAPGGAQSVDPDPRTTLGGRWAGAVATVRGNRSLLGILFMTVGMFFLTVNDALAKLLTDQFSVSQVIAVRAALALLFLVILLGATGRLHHLRVVRPRGQLARGGLMLFSAFLFTSGLALLPLAMTISLSFTIALFTVAMAPLVLGEKVGVRRWTAVLVGFVGVLVIMRPGSEAWTWAVLLPLSAAFFGALRDLITRKISATESTPAIVGVTSAMMMVVFGAISLFDWEPLTWQTFGVFAGCALMVLISQVCLVECFRLAEASLVSPFKYSALLWGTLLGLVIWGEVPEWPVYLGAMILIGSGVYIVRREARLRGRR